MEILRERLKDKEIVETLKLYGAEMAAYFGLDILLSSFFG